jgi:argonaute-like protein implicated in RNA metabolism and viral defense
LFTLQTKHGGEITENPTVGQHFIASESDGYLVATGKPFARQGTALPLHVRKVEGPLSVTEILEDVFWLTNLNWSQPEGCTRHPITIKINDRRLSEDAGQFDENEMEIHEEGVES